MFGTGLSFNCSKAKAGGSSLRNLAMIWLGFMAIATMPRVVSAQATEAPSLKSLSVPPYPFLARLAGTEGTVRVSLTLDPECRVRDLAVSDAPPFLEEAVTPALYGGPLDLSFLPCLSKEGRKIELSYIFSLQGVPTNEWSPTYARVSGDESSITIRITTAPADLDALGLERKAVSKTRSETETTAGANLPMAFSALYYPPIARTANIQGEVKVDAELNSECKVARVNFVTGHPLLHSVVREGVQNMRFPSCKTSGDRVRLTFHFVLNHSSEPSLYDDWAPTYIEMTNLHEFQIKTTARDLVIYDSFPRQ
jgi:hypothetical protein